MLDMIIIVLIIYFVRRHKKNKQMYNQYQQGNNYNASYNFDAADERGFTVNNRDEYKEYFNVFYALTNEMDKLFDEIYKAHLKDSSAGLMTLWNGYEHTAQEILILFKKQDQLTEYEFQELKRKIKLAESQCKEIKRMMSEIQNNFKEQASDIVFFSSCNTLEKLEKRHKILCKAYHPDVGGDEETFKKMQNEYEKLKALLKT